MIKFVCGIAKASDSVSKSLSAEGKRSWNQGVDGWRYDMTTLSFVIVYIVCIVCIVSRIDDMRYLVTCGLRLETWWWQSGAGSEGVRRGQIRSDQFSSAAQDTRYMYSVSVKSSLHEEEPDQSYGFLTLHSIKITVVKADLTTLINMTTLLHSTNSTEPTNDPHSAALPALPALPAFTDLLRPQLLHTLLYSRYPPQQSSWDQHDQKQKQKQLKALLFAIAEDNAVNISKKSIMASTDILSAAFYRLESLNPPYHRAV